MCVVCQPLGCRQTGQIDRMADQNRHMAWALGMALLLHAVAYVSWTSLPAAQPNAGAGALRFALAGDVSPREPQNVAAVTSEAEVPPSVDEVVEPEPLVKPEPVVAPKPVQPAKELPTRRAETPTVAAPKPAAAPATAPTASASSQPVVANNSNGAGQAAAELGVGDANVRADYVATVSAWLNRHKRYPRAAARRGLEGRGEVKFIVTRSGDVSRFEISGSTGFAILDRELKAMLERAAPLPSFPTSMPQAQLEIILPVDFDYQS